MYITNSIGNYIFFGYNTSENALRIATPLISKFAELLAFLAIITVCLFMARIAIDVIFIIALQGSSAKWLDKIKSISSLKDAEGYISIEEYLKKFFIRNFVVLVIALLLFSGQATVLIFNMATMASSGIDAVLSLTEETFGEREDVITEIHPPNIYFNTEGVVDNTVESSNID